MLEAARVKIRLLFTVQALLVFLELLKRDSERLGKLALRPLQLDPAQPNTLAHIFVCFPDRAGISHLGHDALPLDAGGGGNRSLDPSVTERQKLLSAA
jgi:hypothetical protein